MKEMLKETVCEIVEMIKIKIFWKEVGQVNVKVFRKKYGIVFYVFEISKVFINRFDGRVLMVIGREKKEFLNLIFFELYLKELKYGRRISKYAFRELMKKIESLSW
jgi:hypothetical protein